jgi:two-component system chemotaxis response regulator CheY
MKKRILIVEDAPYMREMLVEMLEEQGSDYEVVGVAVNGKEAVEKYKALKPDIVTMDLVMEVMDGIQAIEEIKKYDQKALILAISALGAPEYRDATMRAGADGYLWKPFTVKNLTDELTKLVVEHQTK